MLGPKAPSLSYCPTTCNMEQFFNDNDDDDDDDDDDDVINS